MANCSHVYNYYCGDCGDETIYRYITCDRYKKDCPDLACVKCGELDENKYQVTAPAHGAAVPLTER